MTDARESDTLGEDVLDTILQTRDEPRHRPLLFAHATIHTLDPLIGDLDAADLLLGGRTLVAVGPGLHTAAEDDSAVVVDCTGLTIVPAVVDGVGLAGLRPGRAHRVGTLVPGNPATFAVLPTPAGRAPGVERVLWYPADALAVVADGDVVLWNRRRLVPDPTTGPAAAPQPGPDGARHVDSPHLGTWVDESGFLHQTLTPDGRYDETRGGRPHAYQGSFWIEGDRVVYLDDLGFWAYGDVRDGVLHHAGYVLRRR